MQTWVTNQRDHSKAGSGELFAAEQQRRQSGEALKLPLTSPLLPTPPPPLILPVQSVHLSHLPFGGSKNAYVVGGRLLLDPSDHDLAKALLDQQQPWAVLGVLNGEFPKLHICDQTAVFGRSPDCAVRIDDAHISLKHCSIERCRDTGSALITNHSSNGTYVNARGIEGGTAVLNEGDQVVLLFDRIGVTSCDKTLLGQQNVVDSNGYPVLVGYQVLSLNRMAQR
ncbi:hypothetical protein GGI21_006773 [Coemansia aciculifera]|nr:hypothetical protein GGI21_006773 [Coemansia aciculifera]